MTDINQLIGCGSALRRVHVRVQVRGSAPLTQPSLMKVPAARLPPSFRARARSHMSSPGWNKKDVLAEGRGETGSSRYLHTPVILIYTGGQPTGSGFTAVARATAPFSPSLAR